MDLKERALSVIREAETKLRDLMSEAATAADYANVMRLAGWAKTLSELHRFSSSESSGKVELNWTNSSESAIPASYRKTSREFVKRYPRFFRSGDLLVRVAWSKRNKQEYRHRAPYSTLKALAESVVARGSDGRLFTSDELLSLYDPATGGEVPAYQVHLGISLLKETGLIEQHGRSGYSVPRLEGFAKALESVWLAVEEE